MKEKLNNLKSEFVRIFKENENLIKLWIVITSFVSGVSFLLADEIKRYNEIEKYRNMLCIDASEYNKYVRAQTFSKETYCKNDISYNNLLASYVSNYEDSINKVYLNNRSK